MGHTNCSSPPREAQANAVLRVPSGTQQQQEHDRRRGPLDSREEWEIVALGSSVETETERRVKDSRHCRGTVISP